MKKLLLYIGVLYFAISCGRSGTSLQSGDLLFQVGKESPMSEAITAATAKNEAFNFSHVGIVIAEKGTISVLEASPKGGVRIVSLAEFIDASAQINGKPAVVAMRLKDTTGVAQAVVRAKNRLGYPYDYSFMPDNGKFYCTELVWESYLNGRGEPIFTAKPMNFRTEEGIMPQFWIELFDKLGEPVPEGVLGTNPNDMAKSDRLSVINYW